MKKSQVTIIITGAVLIGWLFNIFPGRFLAARLSTWPVLNRWQILSPQAPIVITNRETVRVEGSGDVLQAANAIKPKISSIVEVKGVTLKQAGSAINLASDGSFVTAQASFADKGGSYFVQLNDGRQAPVTRQILDPATSLVFFRADLTGVPTASLANSRDLLGGDKIIFIRSSLQNFSYKLLADWVSFAQTEVEGKITQSDYPRRSFGVRLSESLPNGEALINTNGDIAGIWNGSEIISSDVLKQAMALYFNSQQGIVRPQFGFSYSIVTQNNSRLTGQPEGALVKDFSAVSAARQAGLLIGDVITNIAGQAVNENSLLEETLQKYKPGDKAALSISRKNQTVSLSLIVGELK